MGTIYYLADKKHRRTYDLGKGGWRVLRNRQLPWPSGPVELRRRIGAAWDATYAEERDWTEYLDRIACEVWGFIRSAGPENVELRNDAGDMYEDEVYLDPSAPRKLCDPPEPAAAFACVGGRYDGDTFEPDPLAELSARYRAEARVALAAERAMVGECRTTFTTKCM